MSRKRNGFNKAKKARGVGACSHSMHRSSGHRKKGHPPRAVREAQLRLEERYQRLMREASRAELIYATANEAVIHMFGPKQKAKNESGN